MIVRFPFNTYNSNFNVCTERARTCFNMSSHRGKNLVLKMLLEKIATAQLEVKKGLATKLMCNITNFN